MSQFENSEIMVKYASLMEQQDSEIVKIAWTWEDIGSTLGISGAAGAAAFGAGTAGAAAVAGAGGLTAALSATPLWMAPVVIALSVPGAPIAAGVLAAGGIGYALWSFTEKADNNVQDLITRLDALDGGNAQALIDQWMRSLGKYKSLFQIRASKDDPKQASQINAQKIMSLKQLEKELQKMQQDWPRVEAALEDWAISADPRQAKHAMDETLANVQFMIGDIGSKTKALEAQVISALSKETGTDYKAVAQEVISLHEQLTQLADGKAPTMDTPDEKAGYQLAKQLMADKAKPTAIQMYVGQMTSLKSLMEKGVKMLQQKSTSGARPYLSKRALTLGNGTKVPGSGMAGKQRGKRRGKKSKESGPRQRLQENINSLNKMHETGAGHISEDNIYGPRTAAALKKLLDSVPEYAEAVAAKGVSSEMIGKPRAMQRDMQSIVAVNEILRVPAAKVVRDKAISKRDKELQSEKGIAKKEDGTGRAAPGGSRENSPEAQWNVKCDPYKHNPSTVEILACLTNMRIEDKKDGDLYPAHQWLEQYGFLSDKGKADVVRDAFSDSKGNLPASNMWDSNRLYTYIVRELKKEPGRQQIIRR